MSKLDELIAELCPDGVEYRKLEEILTIHNGKGYSNLNLGNIPVYGSGGVMTYVDSYTYDKPSVLIPRKGSLNKLYYVDFPFWNVDTIFYTEINDSIAIPKYIFYYLQKLHLEKLNKAGGVPSLTQSVLNKIPIQLPPKAIQEEIVRILDTFSELQAELQTELQAELQGRKEQYDQYQRNLISSTNVIYCSKLGDIATIKTGVKNSNIQATSYQGLYKYINAGTTESGFVTDYNCDGDTITTPSRGQGGIGFIGYQIDNFWLGPLCYKIKTINNSKLLTKYLYYYLRANPEKILQYKKDSGATPSVNASDLANIIVECPPIDEQKRIVSILDHFNTLCNDITQGLPAEIEARRKQYEYYRNRLLTFKPKESTA